jgi:hypothetical protein
MGISKTTSLCLPGAPPSSSASSLAGGIAQIRCCSGDVAWYSWGRVARQSPEGRRAPTATCLWCELCAVGRRSPQGREDEEPWSGLGRPERGWCAARRRCMKPSRPRVRSRLLLTQFGEKVEGGCEPMSDRVRGKEWRDGARVFSLYMRCSIWLIGGVPDIHRGSTGQIRPPSPPRQPIGYPPSYPRGENLSPIPGS